LSRRAIGVRLPLSGCRGGLRDAMLGTRVWRMQRQKHAEPRIRIGELGDQKKLPGELCKLILHNA